ncbi:hypothetical protein [Halorhodospira halophila]|uniref:Transmembrane protein n=1 Tax=Halorhodospira halophila (strain DSM 244 / SL1) TaxID=349124 RepID=A1WUV8_HALHL|nr:hypothetical protein [Halorhodospira halophila]ABM61470.1 hypothetical protein Hhal_0688 [Halorhodospira halophila SL1]MBK1728717.1 hypothetical protein [Halorhodospira halophila]
MTSVVELYEQLASAPDDKTRARLIAEAFERMEERYPEVKDLATQTHLRETELRLQKEIEQLRGDLTREIKQLRSGVVRWVVGLLAGQTAVILAAFFAVAWL